MFERLLAAGFQIDFTSHAQAILMHDFPEVETELSDALLNVRIPVTELIESGGGEARVTQRLRRTLSARGWLKRNVTVMKIINGVEKESVTHEIDHIREYGDHAVALEIEWNNKDPFFDRDLETFKRLHSEGAFSVGVVVTRGISFQENIRAMVLRYAEERQIGRFEDFPAGLDYRPSSRFVASVRERLAAGGRSFPEVWADKFCSDKYGQATTHWRKLEARVSRGVGNPCPLLMIGIPADVVDFSEVAIEADHLQLSLCPGNLGTPEQSGGLGRNHHGGERRPAVYLPGQKREERPARCSSATDEHLV